MSEHAEDAIDEGDMQFVDDIISSLKPKKLWIYKWKMDLPDSAVGHEQINSDDIQVIEYSAYEALQKELADKSSAEFYLHKDDNYYWTPEAWNKCQGLQDKLDKAVKSLIKAKQRNHDLDVAFCHDNMSLGQEIWRHQKSELEAAINTVQSKSGEINGA